MSVLEFTIKTAELGGNAFVVTVSGEADLHTAPELDRALQGVLALGVLLRHQPLFRARGGEVVIVTQDRRVLRTFEISGFDRVFGIERTLADGVAAVVESSTA